MAKITLEVKNDSLNKILKQKEKELPNKIKEFKEKYVKTKVDKMGNEETITNPYAISTYFFKTINPVPNVIPEYTSDQLYKVWAIYIKIIEQINMEIDVFPPTLSHFAKFVGISLERLQELKNSDDEDINALVNKIYDEIFDSNVILSQTSNLLVKPTEYRMKIENEAIEKKRPNVNIEVKAKSIDLDKMTARLREITAITDKRLIETEEQ